MSLLKRVLLHVAHYKAMLVGGMLCLFVANILRATVPIILQQSVDTLAQGITRSLLLRYSAMIIAIAAMQGGCIFAQERLLLGMARCAERDLKNDFYAHLQKLPLEFFHKNRTGELMARATNDMSAAVNASTAAFMYSVNTIAALAIILPVMARLSCRLTLLASAPLFMVVFITLALQKPMRARFKKVQECFGKISARAQEALWAARIVRAYAQESAEIENFRKLSGRYLSSNLRHTRLSGLLYPLLQFFIGLSFVAVLWYGGSLTAGGSLSIGQFLEFILYLGYLSWPMYVLGWELSVLQQGMVSMGRVDSILFLPPAIQDSSCPLDIQEILGSIEFCDVTFKYKETNRPALNNISFRVHPGQWVGLIGAVGSGKSTLMNMIPRLLTPDSGEVLIDGNPVGRIPLKVLRSAVGYVPQETFLFSDTIAANIAFGHERASEEEIKHAAADSGVASDIARFPKGYQTFIGERGVTLSGGQKQRISIARALARHPSILLLDDALSSVDSYTEEKVLSRLQEVTKGKTCLMAAHRTSTLKNADLILVLHEGRIMEQGTHDELLVNGGLYAEIHMTQLLEEELSAS